MANDSYYSCPYSVPFPEEWRTFLLLSLSASTSGLFFKYILEKTKRKKKGGFFSTWEYECVILEPNSGASAEGFLYRKEPLFFLSSSQDRRPRRLCLLLFPNLSNLTTFFLKRHQRSLWSPKNNRIAHTWPSKRRNCKRWKTSSQS